MYFREGQAKIPLYRVITFENQTDPVTVYRTIYPTLFILLFSPFLYLLFRSLADLIKFLTAFTKLVTLIE